MESTPGNKVINIYDEDVNKQKWPEEVQVALKAVMDKCELEDQYIRKRHIYESKQNDLYWHGFQ